MNGCSNKSISGEGLRHKARGTDAQAKARQAHLPQRGVSGAWSRQRYGRGPAGVTARRAAAKLSPASSHGARSCSCTAASPRQPRPSDKASEQHPPLRGLPTGAQAPLRKQPSRTSPFHTQLSEKAAFQVSWSKTGGKRSMLDTAAPPLSEQATGPPGPRHAPLETGLKMYMSSLESWSLTNK